MNDVLFKFIFGKEERKRITIDFLNAVLEQSLSSPIRELTFAPTEMNPSYENDKLTRLDVACVLDSNIRIDIEVQVVNEKNIPSRTLYYWSQLYLMSLEKGQDYRMLKPCFTINILNFSILPQNTPHAIYGVYNIENGHRLLDELELHFLEIPKYTKAPQKPISKMTKIERWVAYFANKLDEQGKEELAMSEAAIKDAMDAAKQFLSDTAKRRAYINRQMAVMDYNSGIRSAKEEGIAVGKEETAIAMLRDNVPLEKVSQYTGLSAEKIKRIAEEANLDP